MRQKTLVTAVAEDNPSGGAPDDPDEFPVNEFVFVLGIQGIGYAKRTAKCLACEAGWGYQRDECFSTRGSGSFKTTVGAKHVFQNNCGREARLSKQAMGS